MKVNDKVNYNFSEPCCFCQHNNGEDNDYPCKKCIHCANNEENKDNQFDFIKNIKYWIGYTRYKNFSKEGKKCTN